MRLYNITMIHLPDLSCFIFLYRDKYNLIRVSIAALYLAIKFGCVAMIITRTTHNHSLESIIS